MCMPRMSPERSQTPQSISETRKLPRIEHDTIEMSVPPQFDDIDRIVDQQGAQVTDKFDQAADQYDQLTQAESQQVQAMIDADKEVLRLREELQREEEGLESVKKFEKKAKIDPETARLLHEAEERVKDLQYFLAQEEEAIRNDFRLAKAGIDRKKILDTYSKKSLQIAKLEQHGLKVPESAKRELDDVTARLGATELADVRNAALAEQDRLQQNAPRVSGRVRVRRFSDDLEGRHEYAKFLSDQGRSAEASQVFREVRTRASGEMPTAQEFRNVTLETRLNRADFLLDQAKRLTLDAAKMNDLYFLRTLNREIATITEDARAGMEGLSPDEQQQLQAKYAELLDIVLPKKNAIDNRLHAFGYSDISHQYEVAMTDLTTAKKRLDALKNRPDGDPEKLAAMKAHWEEEQRVSMLNDELDHYEHKRAETPSPAEVSAPKDEFRFSPLSKTPSGERTVRTAVGLNDNLPANQDRYAAVDFTAPDKETADLKPKKKSFFERMATGLATLGALLTISSEKAPEQKKAQAPLPKKAETAKFVTMPEAKATLPQMERPVGAPREAFVAPPADLPVAEQNAGLRPRVDADHILRRIEEDVPLPKVRSEKKSVEKRTTVKAAAVEKEAAVPVPAAEVQKPVETTEKLSKTTPEPGASANAPAFVEYTKAKAAYEIARDTGRTADGIDIDETALDQLKKFATEARARYTAEKKGQKPAAQTETRTEQSRIAAKRVPEAVPPTIAAAVSEISTTKKEHGGAFKEYMQAKAAFEIARDTGRTADGVDVTDEQLTSLKKQVVEARTRYVAEKNGTTAEPAPEVATSTPAPAPETKPVKTDIAGKQEVQRQAKVEVSKPRAEKPKRVSKLEKKLKRQVREKNGRKEKKGVEQKTGERATIESRLKQLGTQIEQLNQTIFEGSLGVSIVDSTVTYAKEIEDVRALRMEKLALEQQLSAIDERESAAKRNVDRKQSAAVEVPDARMPDGMEIPAFEASSESAQLREIELVMKQLDDIKKKWDRARIDYANAVKVYGEDSAQANDALGKRDALQAEYDRIAKASSSNK